MATYKFIRALTLLAALLASACASVGGTGLNNNPAASFQVKVWLERPAPLKVGDLVQVRARTDRACFLYIYYIAGSGAIRQIFPDNLQSGNRIDPGIIYQIPPPGASYQFRLKPPPAQEKIVAIATLTPVRFFENEEMDYAGVIPLVKLDETAWQQKLNAKLDTLPAATWSADTVYFTYSP